MTTEPQHFLPRERTGSLLLLGLSIIARAGCFLFGVIAVLGLGMFGSLSFGMLAGLLAVAAASIPASRSNSADQRSTAILALSVLGMVCQIGDVIAYYWLYKVPGNHYALPEMSAAFGALALMAILGAITRRRQQHVV